MGDTPKQEPAEDEARFDVAVRMPAGRRLEDVEKLGLAAGIKPERIEALMRALRNAPYAKIGAAVSRERANQARDQFAKAGLTVEVTPVLSLASMVTGSFDGLFDCPNCDHRVVLPESRQCPHCGVFVDKLTEDVLLRRKLREKEKLALDFRAARDMQNAEKSAKLALEARLREEIRKELQEEYGLASKPSPVRKGLVLFGVAALLGAAFIGGRGTSTGWSMDSLAGSKPQEQAAKKGADPQEMLAKIDAGASAGGNTAAAAAANGGAATGDPDVDDPLVQAAGGKRIGAEGISIEQAVAAAQTLAKAGGYKSAGLGEAASSGPAGAGAQAADGVAGGPAAAAAGGQGAAAGAGAPPLAPALRGQLALALTRVVAEMGQVARSREMLKGLRASPALQADPAQGTAATAALLEMRAWALRDTPAGALRPAVEALLKEAESLPPAVRTRSLVTAGTIAARQHHVPQELPRLLLSVAAEAIKVAEPAQQEALAGEWTAGLGEVLLLEATQRVRAGQWNPARLATQQLADLVPRAGDPATAARLHALHYQAATMLGQTDAADRALQAGLAIAAKAPHPVARADLLRSMARLSGAAAEPRMAAAIENLKATALTLTGEDRARALGQLALLHADADMRSRAGEYTQLALNSPQLAAPRAAELHADLLVRGDLAAARTLHAVGLYADAEAVLRRLAGLLL